MEQLAVAAILDQDRPIVVPGALGMGKTTLALAALAHDAAGHRYDLARVERFFVILEPVQDSDGLLRRLAADLGHLAASGTASRSRNENRKPPAPGEHLRPWPSSTIWRRPGAATRRRRRRCSGDFATIEGLRLVITILRGDTSSSRPRRAYIARSSRSSAKTTRALCSCVMPAASSPPTLPCPAWLSALDGHPLSIELLAANGAGKAGSQRTCCGLEEAARRDAATIRRGRQRRLTSLRVSLDISLAALNPPERRTSPRPPDGAVAGRHVRGRQLHDPQATARRQERSAAAGGEARKTPASRSQPP